MDQYNWVFIIFYILFSVLYLLAHLAVIAALKGEFDFLLSWVKECFRYSPEGIELICGRAWTSGPEVWAQATMLPVFYFTHSGSELRTNPGKYKEKQSSEEDW